MVPDPHPFPDWMLDVIATPRTRAQVGSIDSTDGIIRMIKLEETREHAVQMRYGREKPDVILGPGQLEFRRLLSSFLRRLPNAAIVADIACGEAEFHSLNCQLRFVPMDLSEVRLKRAMTLGRIRFGIVCDVRSPALRAGSVDAVVSTNTLPHIPWGEIPGTILELLASVRESGRLAATIPSEVLPGVGAALPVEWAIVDIHPLDGTLSRTWNRGTKLIAKRIPKFAFRRAKWALETASRTVLQLDARRNANTSSRTWIEIGPASTRSSPIHNPSSPGYPGGCP